LNRGYQVEDHRLVDYALWTPAGLDCALRGPAFEPEPGRYIVVMGAAQTFGRFVAEPYAHTLARELGMPVLNLGISGAGPGFFLQRPEMLALVNQSRLAIVQVMSGRSVSNSRFTVQPNQGLVRLADGDGTDPPRFAETAYAQFIGQAPADVVAGLRAEIRARYQAEMCTLLRAISVPKVLFWFSTRAPAWREGLTDLGVYWGAYPHFVDADIFAAVQAEADGAVSSVTAEGLPQSLTDLETGAPVEMWPEARFPHVRHREHNLYYPSPEMHAAAAVALKPAIEMLLKAASAPAVHTARPARDVLVNIHIYKNAGSSLDVSLARSFGERFAQIAPPVPGGVLTEHDLVEALGARPGLLAISSHQFRQPLLRAGDTRLHPYLMLRHPLDRLHSVWNFERSPARQANSHDQITAWAAALDFRGFLDRCLSFPLTIAVVSNFQTRICGTLIGPGEQEDWARDVTTTSLANAMALLETMPAVGVVEHFAASVRRLEAAYRVTFPQFQGTVVQVNRSRPKASLEDRLAAIRAELGPAMWSRILQANDKDLALHRIALGRLG